MHFILEGWPYQPAACRHKADAVGTGGLSCRGHWKPSYGLLQAKDGNGLRMTGYDLRCYAMTDENNELGHFLQCSTHLSLLYCRPKLLAKTNAVS